MPAWLAGVGCVFGVLFCGLVGCLSVPDGPTPECKTSDDCDRSHGEVCEESVCWGNPPPGPFAAVISPPSSRHDLVSREIPEISIPDFGWMGDLALEAPVLLSGKVVAACPPVITPCEPTPIAAMVTVTRRSQFQGGPSFKAVVNVAAGDAYAIPVPRTRMNDDPYTVTLLPSSEKAGARSAAELAPPRRMEVSVKDNIMAAPVLLGGADLPVISGKLTDSLGRGLAGYRVSALGRWDPAAPATEVSSIAYTDAQGAYAVTLSADLAGPVELVARPVPADLQKPPPSAATIHVGNIDATQSSQHDVMEPDSLGDPVDLTVAVEGAAADSGGAIAPVAGAHVTVSSTLTSGPSSFTMSDDEVTGEDGRAVLHLLNGSGIAGSYKLAITPPASSSLGVVFDQEIPLLTGMTRSTLPTVRLVPRVALRGKVLGADGKPLSGVAITARPSLRFLWSLDAAPQAFVAAIPAATNVTDADTGDFHVWVDPSVPNVAQSWGEYDLLIEPPTGANAPTIVTEFAVPRVSALDAATVPDIVLPDAAHVHGRITGPDGRSVEGAELKLYLVSTQLTLCSEVAHAPASCPIPAQLQARNTSDGDGTVRLILPRP